MGIKVYVKEGSKEVRVDFGQERFIDSWVTLGGGVAVETPRETVLEAAVRDGRAGELVYESKPEPAPEPEGDFAYTHGTVNQPLVKHNGWWYTAQSKHGVSWAHILEMYPNAREAK